MEESVAKESKWFWFGHNVALVSRLVYSSVLLVVERGVELGDPYKETIVHISRTFYASSRDNGSIFDPRLKKLTERGFQKKLGGKSNKE